MRKGFAIAALFASVVAVGVFDARTGIVPDASVFYLVPITFAAYYYGMPWGVTMAFASFGSELLAHPGRGALPGPFLILDAALHLLIFLGAAYTLATLSQRFRVIGALESRREFDLNVARELHDTLQMVEPFEHPGLEVAHYLIPARELGGDFLHICAVDGGMFVAVGDISGKGVAAALFTALVHDSLTEGIEHFEGLEALASHVNDRLYHSSPPQMFATALFALVGAGEIALVNAGHEAPLLLCGDAGTVEPLDGDGTTPLGVRAELAATVRRVPFAQGDAFVAFSDGVTDSKALRDTPADTLSSVVRSVAGRDARAIADAVREAARISSEVPQQDDIAIVCVRRVAD